MSDAARLYWGTHADNAREGWWLATPDGRVGMVHGPSICATSGGGPLEAVQDARRQLSWSGPIRVEVPYHKTFSGTTCTICEGWADAVGRSSDEPGTVPSSSDSRYPDVIAWIEKRIQLFVVRLVRSPRNYTTSEHFTLLMELEQIWRVHAGPEPALGSFRRATHPVIDFALEVLQIQSCVDLLDRASPPSDENLAKLRDRLSRAIQGAPRATPADQRGLERLTEAQHVLARDWPEVQEPDLTDPDTRAAHARDMAASLRQQAAWIRQEQDDSEDAREKINDVDIDELEAAARLVERLAAALPAATPARPPRRKRPKAEREPAFMRDLRSWSRHMNDERLVRIDMYSNQIFYVWITVVRYTDEQNQEEPSLQVVDSETSTRFWVLWRDIARVRAVSYREVVGRQRAGYSTSLRGTMSETMKREEAGRASSTLQV